MTNLPTALSNIQIYNCADEFAKNSIINIYPEFFNTNPSKLLDMLEVLFMQKSNPTVHWISFSSIVQSHNESIQSYLDHLRSGAQDCNFICPNCDHGLSSVYIKDWFIRCIDSDVLHADMLAKVGSLKTLKQSISHVEAF